MARRGAEFLICLALLGCGAGVDDIPDVPVATLSAITGELSGEVTIEYTLSDEESRLVNVTFSYGPGKAITTATPAPASPGLTGLETSPDGVTHTFEWDTVADLGYERQEAVYLAIAVTAGVADGIGDSRGPLVVDNSSLPRFYVVSGEVCRAAVLDGNVTGDLEGGLWVVVYLDDENYVYPPFTLPHFRFLDLGTQDLSSTSTCVPYELTLIPPGDYVLIGLLDDDGSITAENIFPTLGDVTNPYGTPIAVNGDEVRDITLSYAY